MNSKTFRQLEQELGIMYRYDGSESLPQWYKEKIDTPFSQFSVEDICICLRQDLFVDNILPIAIQMLLDEPLAGDLYDGELIAALNSLKKLPDRIAPETRLAAVDALCASRTDADIDIKGEIDQLITKLGP